MTRDNNKTVTGKESLALLVACALSDATGTATFLPELGADQPVRLLTASDIKQMGKKMKGFAGKHLFALLMLRDALEAQDDLMLADAKKRLDELDKTREAEYGFTPSAGDANRLKLGEAIARMIGLSVDESLKVMEGLRPGPKAKEDAHRLLSYEVSRSLGSFNVSLVLWWFEAEFRPAIYCVDLDSAFYVHAFLIAPTGRIGFRICPHCTEQFFQDRTNQDYCCPAHRDAHRVARWRAQQKSTDSPQLNARRKNVTQKAR